jgi:hypothetical protein
MDEYENITLKGLDGFNFSITTTKVNNMTMFLNLKIIEYSFLISIKILYMSNFSITSSSSFIVTAFVITITTSIVSISTFTSTSIAIIAASVVNAFNNNLYSNLKASAQIMHE